MKYFGRIVCLIGLTIIFSNTLFSQKWVKTNGPKGAIVNKFISGQSGRVYAASYDIYYSDDSGNNWKTINTGFTKIITSIAVDSNDAFYTSDGQDVHYIRDNGKEINKINLNEDFGKIYVFGSKQGIVCILGTNGQVVTINQGKITTHYSFTYDSRTVSGVFLDSGELFVVNDSAIYISDDMENWEMANDLKYVGKDRKLYSDGKYLILRSYMDNGAVSGDKGKTWDDGLFWGICGFAGKIDSLYFMCYNEPYFSPYVKRRPLKHPNTGMLDFNIPAIDIIMTETNLLISTVYGDIYKLALDTNIFELANTGIQGQSIRNVMIQPEGRIFADAVQRGFWYSDNNLDWTHSDRYPSAMLNMNDNGRMVTSFRGMLDWGLYQYSIVASNDGKKWELVLDEYYSSYGYNKLSIDNDDNVYFVYGGFRIVRDGETHPDNFAKNSTWTRTTDFIIKSSNEAYLIADNKHIYQTVAGASAWTLIFSLPDDEESINSFILYDNNRLVARNNSIVMLIDIDKQSYEILGDHSEFRITDIKISKYGKILRSDLGGVRRWSESNQKWLTIGDSDVPLRANCLKVDQSGKLYAGTIGDGVYYLDFENTIENEPKITTNLSLYPNPASNSLSTIFESSIFGYGKYQIIGISGKILDEEIFYHVIGSNRIDINTKNLANGNYILNLEVGKTNRTIGFRIVK